MRWRWLARAVFGWRWFVGNYPDWETARASSGGYSDDAIVARVLEATLAVRDGRAAFERDGVLFQTPEAEPGLLVALATIAETVRGRAIRLVDFGGALGTTYWRHRATLQELGSWRWQVVEQPKFVAVGQRHFADSPLQFFESVEAASTDGLPDVILASCTLQYLENPHAIVTQWAQRGIPWLVLNNLPLHTDGPDRIAIQRVPPEIYPATYPVWFFNRDRFLASLLPAYDVQREFASEAVWPVGWRPYHSTGLLLKRRLSS